MATTMRRVETMQNDTPWDCDFDLGGGHEAWQHDLYDPTGEQDLRGFDC